MDYFEQRARQRGFGIIAGIDEAGRGPLAGPVVAAAVVLPDNYSYPGIDDSKKLTARNRERLFEVIRADALSVGIGVIDAPIIDEINILRATLLAMKEAVADLHITPDYLLVDGNRYVPVDVPQETIVKGDGRSISIAAASIVAKVSRDRIMEIYHRQFPYYNFFKNKGYGTVEHRQAIKDHGFCKLHRRSFHIRETSQENYELALK
ncbi:MAG TPA: ribonuclease HII [Syntrophales bacterium]|jgi:ribonuclease HII|nr:ribonuclease HII [Syntrophales bacterium]HON22819.1 ribonuclease HII [Syntrophales bacterium]HOU78806.1 ribonuclease HII [Syntrophales bacterium]HPC31589.1 ribonuclease HII [Syntrophales bacterium]HQG34329.1 ribonuclease HII [Syntrophales bacterium]